MINRNPGREPGFRGIFGLVEEAVVASNVEEGVAVLCGQIDEVDVVGV